MKKWLSAIIITLIIVTLFLPGLYLLADGNSAKPCYYVDGASCAGAGVAQLGEMALGAVLTCLVAIGLGVLGISIFKKRK